MLQPKKEKFRKQFRGKRGGLALRGANVEFGEYGMKAMTGGWVTSKEIEAARKKITFMTKRAGKYWLRIFPHKPITKKPVGVKMGSGKGPVEDHVAVVRPGMIIFELGGVSKETALIAFNKAGHKLSVKTKLIEK